MHVLCDFSMFCLNFYTLLDQIGLTYQLSAPSCQFLFSAIFVFQVFRLFKVPKKIRKNYIKNQRPGSFRKNQRREAGPPPGSQKGPWRSPTLGGAAPGTLLAALWVPSTPPFAYIYPSGWKPLNRNSFSRNPLCSAAVAVFRSGLPGEAAPAPCRKEILPPGDHP